MHISVLAIIAIPNYCTPKTPTYSVTTVVIHSLSALLTIGRSFPLDAMFHDPGVGEDLLKRDPLLRVKHQELFTLASIRRLKEAIFSYSLDEISCLLAHPRRNRHIGTSNSPLSHDWCVLERSFTNEKLICENS